MRAKTERLSDDCEGQPFFENRTTLAREGTNGDVTGACSRKSTTNGMTGDTGDVYMYIRMVYMYIYAYMYTVALKSLR
uniref:Uncharacterized protein n=1 Tax=Haemonchus contortus TaxID=6289 RepID=A0A7I4Z0V2_HAECO